jgi:hypothetical protein
VDIPALARRSDSTIALAGISATFEPYMLTAVRALDGDLQL